MLNAIVKGCSTYGFKCLIIIRNNNEGFSDILLGKEVLYYPKHLFKTSCLFTAKKVVGGVKYSIYKGNTINLEERYIILINVIRIIRYLDLRIITKLINSLFISLEYPLNLALRLVIIAIVTIEYIRVIFQLYEKRLEYR